MTEYTSAIASALRMIGKKGDACTWRQYAIDPGATDWTEDETSTFTDYPVSIAFFPYETRTGLTFQQVAGDVTTVTEWALMGAVAFTPGIRDLIIRSNGETVKPAGLGRLKPGAEIVLWQIGIT